MSWLFSLALVEASSPGICLDGAACALWSGTATQPASWLPARTTEACRLSRSGTTFKPLTDAYGQAVLTWCLEDSHARTSVAPERVQESTGAAVECGTTWRGLSVRFDLNTCSWKTAQCLFPGDLPESSVTLPRWGMMRGGECWERTMPGHHTSGTAFGLWRTPQAGDGQRGAQDATKRMAGGQGVRLMDQVVTPAMWPTPRAANPGSRPNGMGGKIIQEEVQIAEGLRSRAIKLWPTPTAQDAKNNGAPSQQDRNTKPLNAEVGGQLNPNWVEWLMGWPIGWTDLKPLETDKCQLWQESHGRS